MKKFIIILLMGMMLLQCGKKDFSLKKYFDGELCVYSTCATNKSVDLGFVYMTKEDQLPRVGESIKLSGLEPLLVLNRLSAKIVKTEVLPDGTEVIYALSNLVPTSIDLDNKKVNLQLANKQDYVVVGWPLIIGSF